MSRGPMGVEVPSVTSGPVAATYGDAGSRVGAWVGQGSQRGDIEAGVSGQPAADGASHSGAGDDSKENPTQDATAGGKTKAHAPGGAGGDVAGSTGANDSVVRWVSWLTVSLAFGFAFFARVAPSGIVNGLKEDFGVSNSLLGTLGAEYFYLYVLNQVPVGAAIAHWGVRKVLIVFMTLALAGNVLFAVTPAEAGLHVGRLLIGVGVSSAFLSFVTVIKEWFDPAEAALVMGLSMAVGVSGAIMGQSPLSALAGATTWRTALLLWSAVPVTIIALAIFGMRDFGPGSSHPSVARSQRSDSGTPAPKAPSLWDQWRVVRGTRQIWVAAAVGFCMNATIMSFSGLWATPFFQARYGISSTEAGFISSAAFLGNALGMPIAGKISDRFRLYKSLVAGSCAWMTVCMLVLLYASPPLWLSVICSFGVGSGVNINVLLSTARTYMRSVGIEGTVAFAGGVMNTFFLSSPILLQPIVGMILDNRTGPRGDDVDPTNEDYGYALAVFPICTGIGAVIALALQTSGSSAVNPHADATAGQAAKPTGSDRAPSLRYRADSDEVVPLPGVADLVADVTEGGGGSGSTANLGSRQGQDLLGRPGASALALTPLHSLPSPQRA